MKDLIKSGKEVDVLHRYILFCLKNLYKKCDFYPTVVVQVEDVMDPKSNPYYQICGTKGKTNKIYLRDGYSHRHAFKKGDTYKISVRCPDVGKVRNVCCLTTPFIQGNSNNSDANVDENVTKQHLD